MAGTNMIDTAKVAAIANDMDTLNKQLALSLDDVKAIMTNELPKAYSGEGSDDTRKAFENFYNKYANEYKELVEKYITYLRTSVVEGYTEVETGNKSLSAQFK